MKMNFYYRVFHKAAHTFNIKHLYLSLEILCRQRLTWGFSCVASVESIRSVYRSACCFENLPCCVLNYAVSLHRNKEDFSDTLLR